MNTMKMLDAPYRAAVVLLVDYDGDVWLAQRSQNCAVLPGQWECPAGKVEPNEDFEAGAVREVYEETGLRITTERLVPCGIIRTRGEGPMNVACALFKVRLRQGEAPRDTEPTKRSAWFPLDMKDLQGGDMEFTVGTLSLLAIHVEDKAEEEGIYDCD